MALSFGRLGGLGAVVEAFRKVEPSKLTAIKKRPGRSLRPLKLGYKQPFTQPMLPAQSGS